MSGDVKELWRPQEQRRSMSVTETPWALEDSPAEGSEQTPTGDSLWCTLAPSVTWESSFIVFLESVEMLVEAVAA